MLKVPYINKIVTSTSGRKHFLERVPLRMKDFAGVLIDNKNTLAIALQRHSMTVVGVCCHIEIILLFSALIVWHDSICDALINVNRGLLLLFKVILMLYLKVENLINLLIDLLGFGRVHKNITIMGR